MENLSIQELGSVQDVLAEETNQPKKCSKCGDKNPLPDFSEEKKGCSTCGDKSKLTPVQGWMLGLAIYILFASIYGTIEMFKSISNFLVSSF